MRRLLLILLVAAAGFAGGRYVSDAPPAGGDPWRATVDRVVDGDTVVVRRGGEETTVRLVQIDAPESSSTRYGRPEKCGPAATRFARRLTAPGDRVTIEPAGRDDTDRYGRVLALVRLGGADAVTWQERIVRAGWAKPMVYRGNRTRLLPKLRRLARQARAAGRGMWGRCASAR